MSSVAVAAAAVSVAVVTVRGGAVVVVVRAPLYHIQEGVQRTQVAVRTFLHFEHPNLEKFAG